MSRIIKYNFVGSTRKDHPRLEGARLIWKRNYLWEKNAELASFYHQHMISIICKGAVKYIPPLNHLINSLIDSNVIIVFPVSFIIASTYIQKFKAVQQYYNFVKTNQQRI